MEIQDLHGWRIEEISVKGTWYDKGLRDKNDKSYLSSAINRYYLHISFKVPNHLTG